MNILVLSPDYPDDRRTTFSFVKQLVDEMAFQGHSIQVIAPYSLTHNKRFYKRKEVVKHGSGEITVYRPYYLSFSNFKIGRFRPSTWSFNQAFRQGLKKLDKKPDVVYGHFWATAFQGYDYAKSNGLPLYVASGESEIRFRNVNEKTRVFCEYVSGVICVSTKNLDESVKLKLTTKDKCVVIPNAINSSFFRKLDKTECRKQLNILLDAFIIIFVGWFVERKGPLRVAKALSNVNQEKPVYSLFIGEGGQVPDCSNILFKGRVAHSELPKYLNAADVFVLPTLHEGCCNAVIEAMACGLPIISSNLPFNWDVLDETNSIMVDPMNIEEISQAIMTFRNNKELRKKLSDSALKKAESLTIDKRAVVIVDFIKERIR